MCDKVFKARIEPVKKTLEFYARLLEETIEEYSEDMKMNVRVRIEYVVLKMKKIIRDLELS